MEQFPDIISTTNNTLENYRLQGLCSAYMRALGHSSQDSKTGPKALNEQRRVISSDQLAGQHILTYNQIDLHLIEGLHSIH